jgi:hypothetical protein
MVRSCSAAFGGIAAAFEGAIPVATPGGVCAFGLPGVVEGEGEEPEVEAAGFVAAGAVIGGLFACGKLAGGFGAKNLAHNKITAIERIEAIRMRISEESSFFFCGSLTNEPLWR